MSCNVIRYKVSTNTLFRLWKLHEPIKGGCGKSRDYLLIIHIIKVKSFKKWRLKSRPPDSTWFPPTLPSTYIHSGHLSVAQIGILWIWLTVCSTSEVSISCLYSLELRCLLIVIIHVKIKTIEIRKILKVKCLLQVSVYLKNKRSHWVQMMQHDKQNDECWPFQFQVSHSVRSLQDVSSTSFCVLPFLFWLNEISQMMRVQWIMTVLRTFH